MPDSVAAIRQALVGRYAVERELGAGGMATVHHAHAFKDDRNLGEELNLGPHAYQAHSRTPETCSEMPTSPRSTNILLSFSRLHEQNANFGEHLARCD